MLRTATLIHPASTLAFRPTPEVALPRALASPRTGLAPASYRDLVARLRHDYSFVFIAPELLDAHAFSNADGYVRSRPNVGELQPQYCNHLRSPANVSELKTTAWHARGQGFESPYLHRLKALFQVLLGLVWVNSDHAANVDVGSSIVSPPQQM